MTRRDNTQRLKHALKTLHGCSNLPTHMDLFELTDIIDQLDVLSRRVAKQQPEPELPEANELQARYEEIGLIPKRRP